MSDKTNFQEEKKAHWQSYETKDKTDLRGVQNQEFFTSPDPLIQRIKTGDYDRKTFLKLMGASAAMVSLNCIRKPVEKIIPYVKAPDYIKPGIANYYASTCGTCSAGCGILVKAREGRPLKIEGNPDHPVSKGALCASGQAGIFDLYDPDRAREPFEIKSGKSSAIEWSALDSAVKAKLAENKGKTRVLTGPVSSPSIRSIIKEFLNSVGGGKHLEFSATSPEEAISLASEISYGKAVVPNYRFDLAKVILSIDADFLGTWISPVEYSKAFSKRRELREGGKTINSFFAAESIPTVTGSNADFRLAIKPGDQRKFAVAVAVALSKLGANSFGSLSGYSLDSLTAELGIEISSIEKIAKALWGAKGSSLVVAGGTSSQGGDAIDLQVAVNLLNSMLDNDGKTIDHVANRIDGSTSYFKNLKELERDLNSENVGVLIINDVNLLYQMPGSDWKSILSKAKLVVSASDRLDETSAAANYLAPVNHYLESWGDTESIKGVFGITQPLVRPLFNSRSFEDMLIVWAGGKLGGFESAYEYIKSSWMKKSGGKNGQRFWEDLLRAGVHISNKNELESTKGSRGFKGGSLARLSEKSGSDSLSLSLYTTVALGDGSGANNSLRQELPDPITKITWDNFVAISPHAAKKLGIETNDVVKVKSGAKEITLPAQVQPGLHKDAVGIALGYGRSSVGKVGNGVGKNSYELANLVNGQLQFSGINVTIEKTGKKYKLACTQDHHMMNPLPVAGTKWDERPLILSTDIEAYNKNPESGKVPSEIPMIHKNGAKVPARGFNPEFEYKGYRWGLAIDLTQCTGCAACVLACQVENNIPVVGRDEVRVGREMHWIRIDRYYIGDPDKPETMEIAHQPVMCQHCENAPCETVCPVAATVHGSEGTNDMVYNRCVGTRYCSNNCP
ncbi:MAG: 4Fe-4S dicluster domain-containing protein, partial [Leptospira sp.]|nr:4Fe-4S dicluster domain-containing protein [Leptospira sp.]